MQEFPVGPFMLTQISAVNQSGDSVISPIKNTPGWLVKIFKMKKGNADGTFRREWNGYCIAKKIKGSDRFLAQCQSTTDWHLPSTISGTYSGRALLIEDVALLFPGCQQVNYRELSDFPAPLPDDDLMALAANFREVTDLFSFPGSHVCVDDVTIFYDPQSLHIHKITNIRNC